MPLVACSSVMASSAPRRHPSPSASQHRRRYWLAAPSRQYLQPGVGQLLVGGFLRFSRKPLLPDERPVLGWHPVGNLRLGNWGVPLAGAWELEVITSEVALSSEPGWRNSAKPAGLIPCAAMDLSIFEPRTGSTLQDQVNSAALSYTVSPPSPSIVTTTPWNAWANFAATASTSPSLLTLASATATFSSTNP